MRERSSHPEQLCLGSVYLFGVVFKASHAARKPCQLKPTHYQLNVLTEGRRVARHARLNCLLTHLLVLVLLTYSLQVAEWPDTPVFGHHEVTDRQSLGLIVTWLGHTGPPGPPPTGTILRKVGKHSI